MLSRAKPQHKKSDGVALVRLHCERVGGRKHSLTPLESDSSTDLVEAAGVEPASEKHPLGNLHA